MNFGKTSRKPIKGKKPASPTSLQTRSGHALGQGPHTQTDLWVVSTQPRHLNPSVGVDSTPKTSQHILSQNHDIHIFVFTRATVREAGCKEVSFGSGRPGLPGETLAMRGTQQHGAATRAPGAGVVNSEWGHWSHKLPKILGGCKRLQRRPSWWTNGVGTESV